MRKDNPHELIEFISKPKQWREKASIILIRLYENDERSKLERKGIFALLVFVIGLLLKLIFFS